MRPLYRRALNAAMPSRMWPYVSVTVAPIAAFVILIAALMLGFMSMLPKEWVLAVAAICAVRL